MTGLRDRITVGVGLDAASRGGSSFIHRTLRVGDVIAVAGPRNHFPLVEDAPKVVLIAGGIGVTPMVCMARRLAALGRDFDFHYAVRSADRAAFLGELQALDIAPLLHVDETSGGPMDVGAAIAGQPEGTHFYCCGPAGMLAAFEAAVGPAKRSVHGVSMPQCPTLILQKKGHKIGQTGWERMPLPLGASGLTAEAFTKWVWSNLEVPLTVRNAYPGPVRVNWIHGGYVNELLTLQPREKAERVVFLGHTLHAERTDRLMAEKAERLCKGATQEEQECYWNDNGCAYRCLDRIAPDSEVGSAGAGT